MRTLIAAATAAGITAVVGGGVALAQPHGTAAPAASVTTIRLVGHQLSEQTIDLGQKGFSPGDEDLTVARLTSNGSRIGTFAGNCTTLAVAKQATQLCTESFQLPHGDIEAAGTVTSTQAGPGPFDWAITGGTGAYRKARGVVHVIPASHNVHMTLHITR